MSEEIVETKKTKKSKKSKKAAPEVQMMEHVTVPFSRIIARDSENVRQTLEGIEELAESIRQNGLLQSPGVRACAFEDLTEDEQSVLEDASDDGEPYYLVTYGFRRYYALQILANEAGGDFPVEVALVPESSDSNDVQLRNITENTAREEVRPADLAVKITELRGLGVDVNTIASRIGKSTSYVAGLLALKKKLAPSAWEAFAEGKISYDAARVITRDGTEEGQTKALKAYLKLASPDSSEKKQPRGAKAAAVEATGGTPKPSTKVIREEIAKLAEKSTEASDKTMKLRLEAQVTALQWCLGERKSLRIK